MLKDRDKYMRLIVSICVVLLYFVWPYFVGTILSMFKIEGDASIYARLISNFLLLFLIIFMYIEGLRADFKEYKKNFKKLFLKGGKIFLIGIVIYTVVSAVIIGMFPNATNDNANSLLHIFDKSPILLLLSTVFYYPIVEELVFKKTFKDFMENKWVFVIITAVINGAFEVMLSYSSVINFVNIIPAVVFYGILSYIYYDTNNVFTSITYRMLYNLIPCIGALANVALILL